MRLIALALCLLTTPALACGPDSDCVVGERTYRLYLPPAAEAGPVGLLVFAHGYRGSAANEMANKALRALADETGMALVALKSAGDDWDIAHRPQEPDQTVSREGDYIDAVLADVATRARIDPARTVASGFSAGGMLTWTLACEMSDRFAGFVPMSGTFWGDIPATCPSPPATVVHIHGTTDRTVPLQGRAIGGTRQGDVGQALAMYAAHGGFARVEGETEGPGGLTCRKARNPGGKLLEFCTFDGGHDFSTERLRYGIAEALSTP